MGEFNDRLLGELIDAVRDTLRKEQADRLRDIYLIGNIEKDSVKVSEQVEASPLISVHGRSR